MKDNRSSAAKEKVQRLQIEIKKEADHLSDTILQYLFQLKVTGYATPPLPRPKRDVVASTALVAQLIEVFNGERGSLGQ